MTRRAAGPLLRLIRKVQIASSMRRADRRRASTPARTAALARDDRIDTLRGLMLVIMTIDHLGGPLSTLTYAPLGYVSAAEGFVFLSGYMFALVYVRRASDWSALVASSVARALLIYRYYLFAIALIVGASLALPALVVYWHLGGENDHPLVWNLLPVAMINEPIFFDILPMYVIFVLASPLAAVGIRRGHAGAVLLASLGLWALGSWVNPTQSLTALLSGDFRAGYFNLLCWQLLWTLGLLLGCKRDTVREWLDRSPRSLWIGLGLFIIVLCLARHDLIAIGPHADALAVNKPLMGWLRLIDTLAMLALTAFLLRQVPRTTRIGWLAYLGQSSIQVFTFQVFLVYLNFGLDFRIRALGGSALVVVYTLVCVLSLTIPALIHHRGRRYA